MGEEASRVNVSSGVITFNPYLHIHAHTHKTTQTQKPFHIENNKQLRMWNTTAEQLH